MKNRIITRLQKTAASYDQMGEKLSEAIEFIMIDLLKEKANEIGFPYDGGVFALVHDSPEYQGLNQKLGSIIDELESIAMNWAEDTRENYPNGPEE